jgi:hypothetical protein
MKVKMAMLAIATMGILACGPRWAYAEDVAVSTNSIQTIFNLPVISTGLQYSPSGILDTSDNTSVVYSKVSWWKIRCVIFKNEGFIVGGGISLKTGQPVFVTAKAAIYAVHNLLAINIGGTAVGGNGGTFTIGPAVNLPEVMRVIHFDKIFPPAKFISGGIQFVYSANRIYKKDALGNTTGNGTHYDANLWGGFVGLRIPLGGGKWATR